MKALAVIAVAAFLAATAEACGQERWPVKTLTDPAAKTVNYHPRPATVCSLGQLSAPDLSFSTPRQPAEKQAYRLTATLVKYKLERDDDIHLVLQDAGCTMIAESPALACTYGAQARFRMFVARRRIEALGPSRRWRYVNRQATITGVLFFDIPHGQAGVAANAVELHPILGFRVR